MLFIEERHLSIFILFQRVSASTITAAKSESAAPAWATAARGGYAAARDATTAAAAKRYITVLDRFATIAAPKAPMLTAARRMEKASVG
jgi:hypothetical protein